MDDLTPMKPIRIASLVAGGGLFAAWLATASSTTTGPAQPPAASGEVRAEVDPTLADIQAQAERLRERLEAAPVPVARRNPFRFGAERELPRGDGPGPPIAPPEPAPVPEAAPPAPILIGIAEQQGPEGVRRTAILTSGGELYLAGPGEGIAGGYRVAAIGPDAVELAGPGGASLVLSLR